MKKKLPRWAVILLSLYFLAQPEQAAKLLRSLSVLQNPVENATNTVEP